MSKFFKDLLSSSDSEEEEGDLDVAAKKTPYRELSEVQHTPTPLEAPHVLLHHGEHFYE
jgi:hypothetical protein